MDDFVGVVVSKGRVFPVGGGHFLGYQNYAVMATFVLKVRNFLTSSCL